MASQAAGALGDQGHAQLMQLCLGSGVEQLNLKKVCRQRRKLHTAMVMGTLLLLLFQPACAAFVLLPLDNWLITSDRHRHIVCSGCLLNGTGAGACR
jgi:hypothetical protein